MVGDGRWRCYYTDRNSVVYPASVVGKEAKLPLYARVQLAQLRRDPEMGSFRAARYIDASLLFFPEDKDAAIPHDQSVDWLRQYPKQARPGDYATDRGYLVVTAVPGDETYPVEIWESAGGHPKTRVDLLDSNYVLVWRRPIEDDAGDEND